MPDSRALAAANRLGHLKADLILVGTSTVAILETAM